MSGTTITRRIAAGMPRQKTVRFSLAGLLLGVLVLLGVMAAGTTPPRVDLSLNATGVTCDNARSIAEVFEPAVRKTKESPPNFQDVKAFGFSAPANPGELKPLRDTLDARLEQVYAKARSAAEGTCTDSPRASIVDADGTSKVLPLIDGTQPMNPVSGSESNRDSRTQPVTLGTAHDTRRTNTWSELDDMYGDETWYTQCANRHLDMDWNRDVPAYISTETEHDNRFILAVNVSTQLTNDQIRDQAALDGNPNIDQLPVVRVDSIINTRRLGQNRCDEFIDTRSMIRVSLGKVIFDAKGNFQELKTDEGIFVDCHNPWRLPRTKPVPTPTPTPSTPGTTPPGTTPPGTTPPGTTPPGTTPPTTPPGTTPPTTKPPKCIPPERENENGKCIVPKKPEDGAGHNNNVPEPVKGTNPPASSKPEPRPADPPATYKPPAPPKDDDPKPAPTKTRTQAPPPPEPEAPKPEEPAQPGGPCAPGIPSC